ncbi:MAG: pitrilysin family protein [Bacteroidota bacterium]|nr:pitrilysin family protein [Bacteroidota bacterium]MDP3145738.1 pitrilysin family protein [Bacteroidota bacterium]MDP3556853.1 pitrilysin family protein [Bacteroidota bacterium]
MINRLQAPAFKTIDKINIMRANKEKLKNGIDFYSINAGSQEITKIEFVFKAGMYYQSAALIASNANTLIESGTKSYTANQISDGIDFFGSFLELEVGQDFATVTLYSLNKYLDKSLKFIEEILKFPTFPEDEFKIHVSNKKQKHQINSQKVDILARRKFSELIFGSNHPYGVQVIDGDYERVNVNEIKTFFNNHYHSNNCTIIASGCLPNNITDTLNEFFGNSDWGNNKAIIGSATNIIQTTKQAKHFIERPDAIQTAVKVGRLLFNKTHQDYFKFQVLNTILGGYFGSRLMANIREDKGYTYGIGSGLASFVNGGYFAISTEVGSDVTKDTLKEIYHEIALLRKTLVSENELEVVRNYVLGHFLRSVDGPFALADKLKGIWEFGLDYTYFDNYFAAVKSVTPKELRDLANKYLNEEDLIECVVGKM